MITCIKCRQEYSEQDHQCLEEMSLEELLGSLPVGLRDEVQRIQEGSERYLRSLFLDTATGEDLDRLGGLMTPETDEELEDRVRAKIKGPLEFITIDCVIGAGEGDGQCPESGLFDRDPVE